MSLDLRRNFRAGYINLGDNKANGIDEMTQRERVYGETTMRLKTEA